MTVELHWKSEATPSRWALVADSEPGYRAEITALDSPIGANRREWRIYENHILLAKGTTKDIATAKRWCNVCINVAKKYPRFDPKAAAAFALLWQQTSQATG